jgi:cytoskeletal protein RodZ
MIKKQLCREWTMLEELKEIGNTFKGKREEMNLTLKEVENATSIRMSYLQALEEGKAEKFLSPVYVVGFIRQYAAFLGMDDSKLAQKYPEAFNIPSPKQEFSYGIGTLETRGAPKGSTRILPSFLYIGISIGMLALAWYFAKFLGVV